MVRVSTCPICGFPFAVGGEVIKCVSLAFLPVLHGFFEDIIFAPEFFRFFFAIDKVHIGIYFVVHIFLLHL